MTAEPRPVPLDYEAHRSRSADSTLLRRSIRCGVLPICSGVLILILFWFTAWPILILMGVLTLVIGGAAVIVGLVSAVRYLFQARRAMHNRRRAITLGVVSIVILLLNFPVALICTGLGMRRAIYPPVTFVVQNKGAAGAVVHITIGTQRISFGDVDPGSSATARATIRGAGTMKLQAERGGAEASYPLAPYVDADSFRGRLLIKLNDGSAQIGYGE